MGNYKGNTEVVKRKAATIADKLRKGISVEKLMADYYINYYSLKKAILSKMPHDEWDKLRYERLIRGGMKTRFKKGVVSYRPPKGVHYSPKTEFKKGQLPINLKQIGTVTVRNDKCGKSFRWIKTTEKRWIPYARFIWEKQYGPVPDGFFVGHKNGRTLNDNPENLCLVNGSEHMAKMKRLNPDWHQKVIKSLMKTCRKRRREKTIKADLKFAAKRHRLRQQKIDAADAEKIAEFRGQIKTVSRWECCGCGEDYEIMPDICSKCNGLYFERIEVPVSEKQETENPTETAAA